MRARVAAVLMLMSLVAMVSVAAPGSSGKTIASESLSATGLTIAPKIAYERASLWVVGPEYSASRVFAADAAISIDLLEFVGGQKGIPGIGRNAARQEEIQGDLSVLLDGRYKYEVLFMAGGKKVGAKSGTFFVENGIAVSRQAKRDQLAAVRGDLTADRQRAGGFSSAPMSVDRSNSAVRSGAGSPMMSTESSATEGYALPDFLILYNDVYPFSFLGMQHYNYATYAFGGWSMTSGYDGELRFDDYFYPYPLSSATTQAVFGYNYFGEASFGIGTAAPTPLIPLTLQGYYFPVIEMRTGATGGQWYVGDILGGFSINGKTTAAEGFHQFLRLQGSYSAPYYTASVGIFESYPLASLHVSSSGDDGSAKVLVTEENATVTGRTLFELQNNGNVQFFFKNTDSGDIFQMSQLATVFQISSPTGSGKFRVRKGGGLQALNGSTEIMALNSTGDLTVKSVTETSSREAKNGFESVDGLSVLEKVAALPISEWSYKADNSSVRHLGPMAEDFHAAFGLGKTDTGITSVDTTGVALAAIQGLNQKLAEKDARISELEQRLLELEELVQALAEH